MKRLCTICARGGSKGVPGKNIRPIAGKPLIAWSIGTARQSGLFDLIAVSSDSDEILEIATEYGADFAIKRPDELASDTAGKVGAIKHAVQAAEDHAGTTFDTLVDLDATSPLRNVTDVTGAVAMLEDGQLPSVITAAEARRSPYFNLVEKDAQGRIGLSKALPDKVVRRQDAPAAYDMNASIYVWNRNTFLEAPAVFYDSTGLYEMPDERSVDIDSELDFEIVEMLLLKSGAGSQMVHRSKFDLSNKRVVVTGAAGILGQHICAALAECGAHVIAIDRAEESLADLKRQLGRKYRSQCDTYVADVADPAACEKLAEEIETTHGPVDVLHNNAASKGSDLKKFFAASEDYDPEVWREIMEVNVDGYFYMIRSFGGRMAKRGAGAVIQTASIYGVVGADQRIYEGSFYMGGSINTPAVYAASKAAVVGMSRHYAALWGKDGVRVNTITPGGVSSGQNETFDKRYSQRVPLNRMGEAHEIASAVVFLASDASSYISGQNLIVDGGLTAW